MRPFALLEPETVREAVAVLAEREVTPLAGGTALLLAMRQRLFRPDHVMWLGRCAELDRVWEDAAGLHVGALSRHATLAAHPAVRARAALLAEAASRVGDPQIRNMATVGGNLCHADPQSDPPAALLALDAEIVLERRARARRVPVERFFTGYYGTAREPDELLVEVVIPASRAVLATQYERFLTTPAEDRPLATLGLAAEVTGGVCRDVRIAVGGAAAVPFRARRAEERLRGQPVSAALCREAAGLAADFDALDDARATATYRRHVTSVMVRRALLRLHGLGTGS